MAQPKIFKVVKGKRVADDYKPDTGDVVRYRFVVDIGDDPKTGKRKQLTRTYDGKRVAERELTKILGGVTEGSFAAPSRVTVDEYLDVWLRSATRGLEPATVVNMTYELKPVRDRLGAVRLQKLTINHLEDLVDWLATSGRKKGGKPGTGLGARSIQLTLSLTRRALNDAVRQRIIASNPAMYVKPPTRQRKKREPWTETEVHTFLAEIKADRLYPVLLLSLLGLRPAEVCGLRWSDVDLDAEVVSIENTRTLVYDQPGGRVVEKSTKTTAGKRTLPLPTPVTAGLKAFRSAQAHERLAAGEAYQASGYLFVDELGQPWRTDHLRKAAYKLMAAAGVRQTRLYDCRHSVLTYLAVNGVPGPIVSAWAGHSDLSMAAKVYIHPSVGDLKQGADALAKLLG